MQINEVTSYEYDGRIAVVTTESPPVNALSVQVRQGIADAIDRANADGGVDAVVLLCGGRTFYPGADISEFGKPPEDPSLPALEDKVERSAKPVIAAIHGTALGGGLELALCAHFRVATPTAQFGLPEVSLGIIPGAGGTQRLPRITGVEKALAMITSGARIGASEAHATGLIDAVVGKDSLRADAVAFATRVIAENRTTVPVRDRDERLAEARGKLEIFDDFCKKNARQLRGLDAPQAAIESVRNALNVPFDQGCRLERALFEKLVVGEQSRALRHAFFAEREARKVKDLDPATPVLPVRRVGVIGAGTMGGGIAMNFLNAGLPVTIVESRQDALDRGIGIIRRNYERTAAKGKLSADDVEIRMGLLTGSLDMADLADRDLVIEAVYEDLDVKRDVFARLDAIARPDAILATNTSYLDIDAIAAATQRPQSVIGLHFFSPANVMPLLEIVRAGHTSDSVLATATTLATTIGKIGVVVGNGFGFVGNRILAARNREADRLVLEGAEPADIDRVLVAFGFAMGHFQMRDLVGLDVGWNAATSRGANVRERLNEMGRHGQKSGGGYYDYDQDRNRTPSPVALAVIAEFAEQAGIVRRPIGDEQIHDRLLYAMVNEGAALLDEGIAARASDIDVIWTAGYGWPRYLGGPMFWADRQGMPHVLETLRRLEAAHGGDFSPSPLIERLAHEGKTFADV